MSNTKKALTIKVENVSIGGDLTIPEDAVGLVIFSHGSGSSRFSPRNNFVAQQLQKRGLATFLFDLLTKEEDEVYANRFDIELLANRLVQVTRWLLKQNELKDLSVGYFGASTGAASALVAASVLKDKIHAVVSRGGRPDMAMRQLHLITSPTLLLVGEFDPEVINLNRQALEKIRGVKSLKIISNATHLFEESGTLEEVAKLSGDWFEKYLRQYKNQAEVKQIQ
jgi:putative phosphoribosyl transferase